MKLVICAVFDEKAQVFATPYFMENEAVAKRIFQGETVNNQSVIGNHPGDFSLYKMGEYDNVSGEIISNGHKCIYTGMEARAQAVAEYNKTPQIDLQEVEE